MDFFKIKQRLTKERGKDEVIEVYPDFVVTRSKDLMVRARSFYAIWDEGVGLWSTDEYDVQRLVDAKLWEYKQQLAETTTKPIQVKLMSDFSSGSWRQFRQYMLNVSDSHMQLDETLTFANTEVKKEDYVSKRLPYSLEPGDITAYDQVISTLYEPSERAKLEWSIGAIVAGDARYLQKFVVLYGPPGSGKGTFIDLVLRLFAGYYTTFEAKALGGANNSFATEVFRSNPLVAVQHDGDLSRIEDNTKLNSIISHEEMTINEKNKPQYTARINAFLYMGSNKPVRISDAQSGIIRRLIDVRPSGSRIPEAKYHMLVNQMGFELGAIAQHCLDTYRELGKDYYSGYRPVEMMLQTDVFFNFVEASYNQFAEKDGISLDAAYALYKIYCEEALVEYKMPRHKFREELKHYFLEFHERWRDGDIRLRSYYSRFRRDKFMAHIEEESHAFSISLDQEESLLDDVLADCPAQYASQYETPKMKWDEVKTTLKDLDTAQLHYVKPPANHIVIDFDLKDANGDKSAERNIEAASQWPATYAEFSKSGAGIHLHYEYSGDVGSLSRVFEDGIEVKVFVGNASLRRMRTASNGLPISKLSGGLPVKEKRMLDANAVQSERSLRNLVIRNLKKEIHPATKPSVDFIHKILKDAYESGLVYDLTTLRPDVISFASSSTNQSDYCLQLVADMQFKSEEVRDDEQVSDENRRITFFDVESFPNLFVVSWKYEGEGVPCVSLINPTSEEIEPLLSHLLAGFNNRRYDNHMVYACFMGYSVAQLYELSQKLIGKSANSYFGEAYNLSYLDCYEYFSEKKSLKKFQIELGLQHKELGLPWDEPVPEELWPLVVNYCENDVVTLEQVFNARKQDLVARKILAALSGLSLNETTQRHTSKIIFQGDKKAREQFVYTDLSETFPGYKYEFGKSTYRGEDPSEGGYVYSEPGMYTNVCVLDVVSMHPNSIRALNLFGPYTSNFTDLVDARVAIKHKEYDKAKEMLGGKLAPFLGDDGDAKALSYALKIVINIVYGMTSAKFKNDFNDDRNVDNIVAKRGALFMIDLKNFVQERGFQVIHIKTDSIKIPDATPEIIAEVTEFGKRYGYDFEHETTYKRFCLVNDAVYVGLDAESGGWDATGAQFIHPYVFKTCFSKEPVTFEDLCETKAVTTSLHLDLGTEDHPNRTFLGRITSVVPVRRGGGLLVREKDGAFHAATGSKGFKWLEAEHVKTMNLEDDIDMSYYQKLVDSAIDNISKFGDYEWFVAQEGA